MKVFVFDVFLFNWPEKQITSFKNLYIGFRATLNFCKNDVSLKPMYRFFFQIWKTCLLCLLDKNILNSKTFTDQLKLGSVWPLLTLPW